MPVRRGAMAPRSDGDYIDAMLRSTSPLDDPASRPHRWLAALALVVVVNVLIAALLAVLAPAVGDFRRNLVFSQCIGLSVFASGVALRQLPAIARLTSVLRVAVIVVSAVPIGTLVGYLAAYTLLGEPTALLSAGPGRTAAVVATVLGSALVGYLVWMQQRLALEATQRARAQQLAAEAQLRLLRAQIEPHMLFNTLANLHSLVDDDPALAKALLDRLTLHLRAALAASRSEWVTLAQEFEQLGAYLEIMAVRLGPRLSFDLRLPDDLAAVLVPPMLLQPLVENAIKHGIEPKVGGGRVEVLAQRSGEREVALIVTDTGLGQAQVDADHTASHYGLNHVRERLQSVYGDAASFSLGSHAPCGTRAVVRIPA